jgi:hypothetical protein
MTEHNTKRIVLAFDIEKAGPKAEHNVIAIGASVVDQDFNKLDELFVGAYFKDKTEFETLCWEGFWSKNVETLQKLEYNGDNDEETQQQIMIVAFQEFRKKWEYFASQNGYKFELCTDNNIYDGGFVNQMIAKYLNEYNPIPYNARPSSDGTPEYAPFWETHSMQRGLLMQVDPTYTQNSDWGYSDRINELYEIPEAIDQNISHDHLPHHDAYTIACDLQILHGIQNRTITFKKSVSQKGYA